MKTNPPASFPALEAGWKTYLKAVAFVLPALVLWAFATVYFAPKLHQLWVDGGGPASEAQWVMDLVLFLVRNSVIIGWGIAALLVLYELALRRWGRYRRAVLGSLVMTLNSAVLVGLWFMCLASLLIAPALSRA